MQYEVLVATILKVMKMKILILITLSCLSLGVTAGGSRGDGKDDMDEYFAEMGIDVTQFTDDEDELTADNEQTDLILGQLKQYNASLLLLFDHDDLEKKVFSIPASPNPIDYLIPYFYIQAAKKKDMTYRSLSDLQKLHIENVLEILITATNYLDPRTTKIMQTAIEEGITLSNVVNETRVLEMIANLETAAVDDHQCLQFSGSLVAMWMRITDSNDDSSIHDPITSLLNINWAMRSTNLNDSERNTTVEFIDLLSTKRNRKLATQLLGSDQQLQDFVKDLFCKDNLSLRKVEELLLNTTEVVSSDYNTPEDIQSIVELQRGLVSITNAIVGAGPNNMTEKSIIPGANIGEVILSSYMELADKAINPEQADVWAKMTLQDAEMQLKNMLLSNENYVGALSGIVMNKQKDGANYTLDKETITVSLSNMKLKENKSHAEFQYEDTFIETDSLASLSPSEGDDLQVYALRYKSWSQIINDILEKHMTEIGNKTMAEGKSRKIRSVGSIGTDFNSNKSFIGKGGVISLSTRQQGIKKSVPVTYWISFHNVDKNSDKSLTQCLSCEYLDPETIEWRYGGCYVAAVNDSGITCKCNHTTNFAAFVMPAEAQYEVTDDMKEMFRWLSLIGSTLSVVGLVLSLIIFLLVRKIVRNERLKAHTHLSVALLALHLLFLGGEAFVLHPTLCVAITVLSHYFLLATFFWMLIEGIFLYIYVVQVFLRSKIGSYSWMYLVGWGIPLLIVALAAGIGLSNGIYITPIKPKESKSCPDGTYTYINIEKTEPQYEKCWLSTETGMAWSFLAPAIIIIIFNTIIMCRTLKICIESMRNSASMKSRTGSYSSSAMYNSSTNEKSFESSGRQYDSYHHLHGQATTDAGYAVSPSPCLLQVTVDEEPHNPQNQGSGSDVTSAKHPCERDSNCSPDYSRYHSVSGDSVRFNNSRSQSVVYRTAVNHSQNSQVQLKQIGNKMAQLVDRATFFKDVKAAVKGAIVLLPILGVPWICGFFSHLSPVFVYLFIVLNSTQGVFVFIVYGLKNGEVRRAIQRKLHTRNLKNSVDSGIRRSSSATSVARSFLRFGRRRSTVLTTT